MSKKLVKIPWGTKTNVRAAFKASEACTSRNVVVQRICNINASQAVDFNEKKLVVRGLFHKPSVASGVHQHKFSRPCQVVFSANTAPATPSASVSSRENDVVSRRQSLTCLVISEFQDHDLLGLILKRVRFSGSQQKCIIKQILQCVDVLHDEHQEHMFLKSKFF